MTGTDLPPKVMSFDVPLRLFDEAPKPFSDPYARRCFRLLRMVAILHAKGFQGLRIFPHLYPLAYRVDLYPVAFADLDGVKYNWEAIEGWLDRNPLIANYSGADGARYFGWEEGPGQNAHGLAVSFLQRFPELARSSYQLDLEYAGWFATLLGHCEYGYLPYLFSESEPDIGVMRLQAVEAPVADPRMMTFPMPPRPSPSFEFAPRPAPSWMATRGGG
jgi:hypothetical protein